MERVTELRIRLALALALLVCCVGCDQATKRLATKMLSGRPAQSYCFDTLRLQYALNPGGFLNLGADLAPRLRFWIFAVLNAMLLGGAAYVLAVRWNMQLLKFVAVVLILAGGVGNQIDRTMQGGLVTDFLNVGIGPLRTGIFNVADMALMAGAIVLLIASFTTPASEQESAE